MEQTGQLYAAVHSGALVLHFPRLIDVPDAASILGGW